MDQGVPIDPLDLSDLAPTGCTFIPWRGGESCKTRESKAALEDRLLGLAVDPSWGICAIGGGALLDLVGYVASGLLRGLRLILVPTTLVAMVDASLGSKNGINHPLGKNLLGTLYDPSAIWLDLAILQQMPVALYQQGAAEMIKHALLGAREHLASLTRIGHALVPPAADSSCPTAQQARTQLARLVLPNLQVKDRVVRRSLKDPEWRHLLNAGHTLAHGWESASHYTLHHGQAVGAGLWIEAQMAYELGMLHDSSLEQLEKALQAWGFGVPCYPWERVLPFLLRDKKNESGRMLLSLPSERSTPDLLAATGSFQRTEVDLSHIQEVYERCQPVCA
jgi:3-dehydroquinate synthetase